MKKNLINVIVGMITLMSTPALKAQSNCDELKKENEYLKKALQVTTPTKTFTSSKIDFNLISCVGNIKEQTVSLVLTLVNHDANRPLQFSRAKAIDLEGNEYPTHQISIGSGGIRNDLYTDVPIKVLIKYNKVLPSVKLFKIIPLEYYDDNSTGIEYRDITVTWK